MEASANKALGPTSSANDAPPLNELKGLAGGTASQDEDVEVTVGWRSWLVVLSVSLAYASMIVRRYNTGANVSEKETETRDAYLPDHGHS